MSHVTGDWLTCPATQKVMTVLNSTGHRAYFVGGCVRNSLLGVAVWDVDIATDLLPDQVIELAKAAGLKPVPTGIEHGTVTVVSGGIGHEITTFRKDIETDGRRAVVSYSDNITDDARRRDFTMNALYADQTGQVFDPLNGLDDLRAARVRFIDDADARIKEDYLRTLRFFRFHAWYGDPAGGMDAEALAAISANLSGLETLSKERVGSEIKKLLSAKDPAPAVAAMAQAGVLAAILPGADHRSLAPLVHLEAGEPPDAIRRLAVLGGTDIGERLRLSRKETMRLSVLRDVAESGDPAAQLGYRYGAQAAIDGHLLLCAALGQPVQPGFRGDAQRGGAQVFPIKAADLMPAYQGVALGKRMKELEDRWVNSDFKATRSQLLA